MASRGSVAKNGHVTTTEYETEYIYPSGSEVLRGKHKIAHGLPDYSHMPNRIYIKNNDDGTFREMRFYDSNGKLFFEIAYHPEPSINNGNRDESVWHFHEYDDSLNHGQAQTLKNRSDIVQKYKIYLMEVGYDQW